MQLEHHFTVPASADVAWDTLLDIERVAPCMPGASLDGIEGDEFTGRVKVRLGPVSMLYKGVGRFIERDRDAKRVRIEASGKDSKGNGTAAATVTATLVEAGGNTEVTVLTDLNITGRPAQFGRGMISEVGNKLIGQFADNLAATMSAPAESAESEAAGEPASKPAGDSAAGSAVGSGVGSDADDADRPGPGQPYAGAHAATEDDAIDLLDLVDEGLVKKIAIGAGIAVGALALFVLIRRVKKRRRRGDDD